MNRRWLDYANLAFAIAVPLGCTVLVDPGSYQWTNLEEFAFFFGGPLVLAVAWIDHQAAFVSTSVGLRLLTLLPLIVPKKRLYPGGAWVGTFTNVTTTIGLALIGFLLMVTVLQ